MLSEEFIQLTSADARHFMYSKIYKSSFFLDVSWMWLRGENQGISPGNLLCKILPQIGMIQETSASTCPQQLLVALDAWVRKGQNTGVGICAVDLRTQFCLKHLRFSLYIKRAIPHAPQYLCAAASCSLAGQKLELAPLVSTDKKYRIIVRVHYILPSVRVSTTIVRACMLFVV